MKKIFSLIIVFLFFLFSSVILTTYAQEDTITIPEAVSETEAEPQAPEEPAPAAESGQLPLQNQQPAVTAQKVVTSSLSCVKVGNPPEEERASVCKETSVSDSGFIGPVTLEPCGQDPEGNLIQCIKPGYVFYCQGDPRWANTCHMIGAGCGPTTMAMIFSAYGDTIIPPDMDKIFQQRGWRVCGDHVSYMESAIKTLLPESGYEYHKLDIPLNLQRAQEYLNAGYLIIGSTFGHIFVIDGVNDTNKTLRLRDPGRCENKDGVIRSASAPWGGQPLMYAYAVKKLAN